MQHCVTVISVTWNSNQIFRKRSTDFFRDDRGARRISTMTVLSRIDRKFWLRRPPMAGNTTVYGMIQGRSRVMRTDSGPLIRDPQNWSQVATKHVMSMTFMYAVLSAS
jgi:hypothetical protein